MVRSLAFLVLGTALLVLSACAPSDPGETLFRAGAPGVTACGPCHDPVQATDAIPGTPRLPGQQAGYIVSQLNAFRSGARQNAVMSPAAAKMTDQQITDVAAYLSKLRAPQRTNRDHLTPDETMHAATVFANGVPAQGLAPCATCHGARGQGTDTAPKIAGQDSEYATARLQAFRSLPASPMHDIVAKLSPDDAGQMAAYLATLKTQEQPNDG
jgi:cytochrome c553